MRPPIASLALGAALFAGAASAQPAGTSLTLVDGSSAPARIIIDGASWRCAAGTCVANGGTSQPAPRACRRVVARLGAVGAFTWQGTTLTAEELAVCNAR